MIETEKEKLGGLMMKWLKSNNYHNPRIVLTLLIPFGFCALAIGALTNWVILKIGFSIMGLALALFLYVFLSKLFNEG